MDRDLRNFEKELSRFRSATSRSNELILNKMEALMASLDDILVEVKQNTSLIDSAVVLIKSLREKILSAGVDPVKLKEITDELNSQEALLAGALVENTEATPPVPEPVDAVPPSEPIVGDPGVPENGSVASDPSPVEEVPSDVDPNATSG